MIAKLKEYAGLAAVVLVLVLAGAVVALWYRGQALEAKATAAAQATEQVGLKLTAALDANAQWQTALADIQQRQAATEASVAALGAADTRMQAQLSQSQQTLKEAVNHDPASVSWGATAVPDAVARVLWGDAAAASVGSAASRP